MGILQHLAGRTQLNSRCREEFPCRPPLGYHLGARAARRRDRGSLEALRHGGSLSQTARGLDPGRSLGALPRADLATFEELWRERFGAPMIVTGIAESWKARATWTRRRLLDELGVSDDREAISRALPGSLAGAISFPSVAPPQARRQANVWVAPDGAVSHLHFDLYENLLTIIGGEKDVILFPPSQTRRLYPYSALQHAVYPSNSQVDLDRLDLGRFPRVRSALYWSVTLTPDETLYIPPRFWHFVRSRGESVAVNVWFDRQDRTLLERTTAVPLRLRANNLLARLRRA